MTEKTWEQLFIENYRRFTGVTFARAKEVYELNKKGIEIYKAAGETPFYSARMTAKYNLELPRTRRGRCR